LYTNPSNIIKTLIMLLEKEAPFINQVVTEYQGGERSLCVFEGIRRVLPVDAYPSFEIEPTNSANQWATTRSQRPRYNFTCNLTVKNDNEKYGVEYIATLANKIVEIMTNPANLQLRILNETKWSPSGGLSDTYMLDSLVEDASYNAAKSGSIRIAEFSWFVSVHEPFPDSAFMVGGSSSPTIVRPHVV
jgi:hypothetical protein